MHGSTAATASSTTHRRSSLHTSLSDVCEQWDWHVPLRYMQLQSLDFRRTHNNYTHTNQPHAAIAGQHKVGNATLLGAIPDLYRSRLNFQSVLRLQVLQGVPMHSKTPLADPCGRHKRGKRTSPD